MLRLVMFFCLWAANSVFSTGADTIFFGGDIITVNDQNPEAEAVAVTDGKIVFVGDKKGAFQLKDDHTVFVNLQGKTLLPGFINSHTHILLEALIATSTDVSAFKYKKIDEVMAILKEAAKKGPVLAFSFDPSLMTDPGELNFKTLDAVSTEVPIVVVNKSAHIVYGNHKAFELAGITDATKKPAGGSYQKDSEGHLTGVGYETPAIGRLVSVINKVNQVSTDQYEKLLKIGMKIFADAGYTTITDLALGFPLPTPEEHIQLMRDASNAPDAIIRSQGYVVTNLLNKIPEWQKQNNENFKILGFKIWADGSIQGYTAAMKEKYKNSNTKGTLNLSN